MASGYSDRLGEKEFADWQRCASAAFPGKGKMRRSEIMIPPRLDFDRLRRIASIWPHDVEHITLNMRRQEWVYPIGTTGLSCLVAGSILRGQHVCFDTDGCQNLGYWGSHGLL
jgi:hypothetical protein